jgi:type II secretory pathway pseudopilin PulG
MNRERLSSEKGFTLLAALFILMIMGIMLGMMGESWSMIMRRDREEELLFRGKQIKTAIERFNKNNDKYGQGMGGVRGLDSLLKDYRSLETNRYLRKEWKDPISGKEWQLIKDPVKGVIGVASPSDQEPLKKANFPEEFKDFVGKDKYSKWQFLNLPPGAARPAGTVATTITGLPATGAGSATGGQH